ncbi:MAG TPA: Gfo/Idh/MocA family oxidoreductase [Streptosporangiaceae bacterium]|jgi:myo-inositol 2-dehydrogenase/D-chiro-inositol 1-dehydrogenase
MTHRVRVGLAGMGRMGRIHAASLATRCPSAELACVFDADAGLASQVADQFGVARAESYESILTDDTVDAVAIATPTGTQSWRSGRTVTVAAERTSDGVRYTVKQESR